MVTGTQRQRLAPVPVGTSGSGRRLAERGRNLGTRIGRTGLFRPLPWPSIIAGHAIALYELAPLARKVERLVDFDRLNSGEIRVSIVATDLNTGEATILDTAAGDVIRPEHILASCGLIPEFEPTEVGGRLLGDGGLVANAPVELVLGNRTGDEHLVCSVLDLFATDAGPPSSLEHAAELRRDFLMAAPTHRALQALGREDALRRLLAAAADAIPSGAQDQPARAAALDAARRGSTTVLHLSYRSEPGEAGPEKQFDFSRASLSSRRKAGAADMVKALRLLDDEQSGDRRAGFAVHRVRR